MNRTRENNQSSIRDRAHRRAFQRLEAALARARESHEKETASSENQRIDRVRLALFGCLAE